MLMLCWEDVTLLKQKEDESKQQASELTIQKKDAAKTPMLRAIAHEIRNPLTAIKIAGQMLDELIEKHDLNEQTIQKLVPIIYRNVHRIEADLKKLVQNSSSDASSRSRCDLAELLETAISQASDRIYLKKINVERSYQPDIYIKAIFNELTTAFLNIIVNAIEAIQHDHGVLWLSVYASYEHAIVIIQDNGAGMDPSVLQQIFHPQFTIKEEGLGMGLTNVKKIFDQHGALVDVSSEPGTGTTFTVRFSRAVDSRQ